MAHASGPDAGDSEVGDLVAMVSACVRSRLKSSLYDASEKLSGVFDRGCSATRSAPFDKLHKEWRSSLGWRLSRVSRPVAGLGSWSHR